MIFEIIRIIYEVKAIWWDSLAKSKPVMAARLTVTPSPSPLIRIFLLNMRVKLSVRHCDITRILCWSGLNLQTILKTSKCQGFEVKWFKFYGMGLSFRKESICIINCSGIYQLEFSPYYISSSMRLDNLSRINILNANIPAIHVLR